MTHEGQPEAIEYISMDMSKAFQAGARKEFPNAEICFDAFHVSQLVHDALDAVRRSEVKHEGWIYLAVVIDLYSRKIVGWSMGHRINARLACDALQMAIWNRRPEKGLIFHSDRGVQYASHEFRRLLKANGILGSMSRKGDCWDNSVVESFFGKLKSERVHWRNYQTRSEARVDVVEYITMRHNSIRLHSYLGYLSPDEFERRGQPPQAA